MSNMLRGSLTSTTDAKGVLGFKGERGYSNYELYVKNGGTMTEQEWLDHFGLDLTDYAKTSEVIDYVGELSELETEDKTNIVSAINENKTNIDSLDDRDNYSTTERVIGIWENSDGTQQPIYRKMKYFSVTTQAVETWTPIFDLTNVKDVIKAQMGISSDSGSSDYPWSAVWYDTLYRYNNGNVEYYSDRAHKINYIVVEYTKTTD